MTQPGEKNVARAFLSVSFTSCILFPPEIYHAKLIHLGYMSLFVVINNYTRVCKFQYNSRYTSNFVYDNFIQMNIANIF